jgi:hypothetical protein
MPEEYDSFKADQRRFRLWLGGIVAAVVLLAVAGWLARPAYRHFKERRESAQAQTFLAAGNYRNAALSARQALSLNPTNVAACRVMVALADLAHNPIALDFQQRIVLTEPTVGNKLQMAVLGLRYQRPPFPLTAQLLDELAPVATNLASYHVLAASLAVALRRPDAAEIHFEAAVGLDPTNQLDALNLAIIRLESTNATRAASARALLETLRTNESLAVPALRALVADRLMHRDVAAAQSYSTQLLAQAKAALADQLQHLGILQQLKSGDFPARLAAVEQLAQTNAPSVAEMAAWMQANDLLADDLQWLTHLPAGLQSQTPVRLALANAYLQSADWRALRDFVGNTNWGEMEFLRLALEAHAWSQLGEQTVADSHWNAAVNEAGGRFGPLTTLLGLTEDWKLRREQKDLLQLMVERFPRERWAQDALEQACLAEGNTVGLNQLYAKLLSRFPNNAGFKNNLAFTSLLLNTNVSQACRWAEAAYAGRTNDPAMASTYALALHLQGHDQDGLAVLQRLDARFLQQPDTALYYGVLLAATGATNEAAPFFKIAQTKTNWLPEERHLLAQALGRSN